MIREWADVAILGAGFAGSVLAMVLRRLGRSVVLVERGAHPRFAVGESSTPLANLVLESLRKNMTCRGWPRWRSTARGSGRIRIWRAASSAASPSSSTRRVGRFRRAPTAATNCWSAPTRPTTRPTPTGSANTSIISSSRKRMRSGRPTTTARR